MIRRNDPRLHEIMRAASNKPAYMAATPGRAASRAGSKYMGQLARQDRAAVDENTRLHQLQQNRLLQERMNQDRLNLRQKYLDQNRDAYGMQRGLNWAGTGVNLANLAQQYFVERPAAKVRDDQILAALTGMSDVRTKQAQEKDAYIAELYNRLARSQFKEQGYSIF